MKICNQCGLEKEKYYKKNNVCAECFRARRYKHRRDNPKLNFLVSARHRAKTDGVSFDITPDDIDIPEFCPVLGIKLQFNYGVGGAKDNSPSIDRLIPELGYVKGNIAVISWRANRIKNNATIDEIKKVYDWILKEAQ